MDTVGQITNPQGMAIIWNYQDRITSSGSTDPSGIEQVIIGSASLKSITTSKQKSRPEGTFELRLAPTFNWVARLTPGSWCTILMTKDEALLPANANVQPPATRETLKMLGRIHSVRAVVSVDQTTGARNTEYIVSGEDWASVFNTSLYIDPIAKNNNLDTTAAVGHAARLYLEKMILSWTSTKNVKLPTPSHVIRGIIDLWGNPIPDIAGALAANPIEPNLLTTSQAQFTLPKELMIYMKQPLNKKVSNTFAHLITLKEGVLEGKDKYSGDTAEAFGFPRPDSFYGMNSFWQLLTDNCNPVLNELVADITWTGTGAASVPQFTLYKRIKPFITQPVALLVKQDPIAFTDPVVTKNISKFQDVRCIDIALEDVIGIHAGTNWRDKINFIEIKPQPQLNQSNHEVMVKLEAQTADLGAIERDGFKPLIQKVEYMPYDGKQPIPLEATKWKYLLREWYFNTHNMLNGSMTIVGQNEYIGVGDNVRIPIRVLGDNYMNSGQISGSLLGGEPKIFLLAHVESINNNFNVTDHGARSFKSTIDFSRGIVVNDNGIPLARGSNGALDQDASDLPGSKEKNTNVFGTSTEKDPDLDKLKGN